MLYAAHEDDFDQEDQVILERAAARLKAANAITPAQPVVDPWEAWAAQQAQIFSKCLDAAVRHMPYASADDRRHAATVLYGKATAQAVAA